MGPSTLNITKVCTVCKEDKELNNFYNSSTSNDGKCYRCKTCDNKARKKYYLTNEVGVEKRRMRTRKYRYKKFGLTQEDYDKRLVNQGGVCAICKGKETRSPAHSFSVDHCHMTGKVRGLLCNNCNRGLGMLGDTEEDLRRAYEYLKETH